MQTITTSHGTVKVDLPNQTHNSALPSPASQLLYGNMDWKEIIIDTNYNHKLDSEYFFHIAAAPLNTKLHTGLMMGKYRISTRDSSHQPVMCMLIDWYECPLNNVPGIATYASHALSAPQFKWEWQKKYGYSYDNVVVYYYMRL